MKSVKYPKILALGTPEISSIFDEPVEITEKIDGSQLGFGRIDGELIVRSKGRELRADQLDKLFKPAYEYIQTIADKIPDNTFFYAETLCAPRHSTLAYKRIPKNHIALFAGMDTTTGKMMPWSECVTYTGILGIDMVPILYEGKSSAKHILDTFFNPDKPTVSYLGGQPIEGVVVKNYKPWLYFDMPQQVMAGKYVSEAFKEVHNRDWSKLNTGKGKFETLKEKYHSEARWEKALMRLKEAGVYTGTLKDIGALISEVRADVVEECGSMIRDDLYQIFAEDIIRNAAAGIPDWFKKKLLEGNE